MEPIPTYWSSGPIDINDTVAWEAAAREAAQLAKASAEAQDRREAEREVFRDLGPEGGGAWLWA